MFKFHLCSLETSSPSLWAIAYVLGPVSGKCYRGNRPFHFNKKVVTITLVWVSILAHHTDNYKCQFTGMHNICACVITRSLLLSVIYCLITGQWTWKLISCGTKNSVKKRTSKWGRMAYLIIEIFWESTCLSGAKLLQEVKKWHLSIKMDCT